jgi:hypothetical protein
VNQHALAAADPPCQLIQTQIKSSGFNECGDAPIQKNVQIWLSPLLNHLLAHPSLAHPVRFQLVPFQLALFQLASGCTAWYIIDEPRGTSYH